MNYWQTLLVEQKGRGKKGFSLPFIIGSQKYLPITYPRQTVEDLILDIATNSTFPVFLKYCWDTGDFFPLMKGMIFRNGFLFINNTTSRRLKVQIGDG